MACRKVKTKRELVRVVRITDGSVRVDASGREAGRGAYLCRARECWQKALKGDKLEHALRTALARGNREELVVFGEGLGESGQ